MTKISVLFFTLLVLLVSPQPAVAERPLIPRMPFTGPFCVAWKCLTDLHENERNRPFMIIYDSPDLPDIFVDYIELLSGWHAEASGRERVFEDDGVADILNIVIDEGPSQRPAYYQLPSPNTDTGDWCRSDFGNRFDLNSRTEIELRISASTPSSLEECIAHGISSLFYIDYGIFLEIFRENGLLFNDLTLIQIILIVFHDYTNDINADNTENIDELSFIVSRILPIRDGLLKDFSVPGDEPN